MPLALPNWMTPCAFGSGKFGTPWERMHAANFAPSCVLIATPAWL